MNESRSSLYPLLTGLAGGALAWSGVELILSASPLFPDVRTLSLTLGAAAGFLLGAVVPMTEGLRQAQGRKIVSATLLGAAFGTVAGAAGMAAGQYLLSVAADAAAVAGANLAGRGAALARIPGWVLTGTAVGAVSGLRSLSPRRIAAGALGGFLGGLAGGIASESLAALVHRYLGRAAGMLCWGVAVAFLADRLEARRAMGRITVLSGPLKGRSFPVNQRKMRVGSRAGSDITLVGNASPATVAADSPEATVKISRGTVVLEAGETGGVELNGRKAQDGKTVLKYDDVMKVDGVTMIYEARR